MDLNPENVKVEDNEIWIYGHDFSRNTFWRQNKFTVKAQQHYKKFHNLSRNSDDVVCHLSTHESCCNTKPEDIAKFIIDRNLHGKDINLYFVTDGEIDKAAINKCKSLNLRINYKKLILVSINENLKVGNFFSLILRILLKNILFFRTIQSPLHSSTLAAT